MHRRKEKATVDGGATAAHGGGGGAASAVPVTPTPPRHDGGSSSGHFRQKQQEDYQAYTDGIGAAAQLDRYNSKYHHHHHHHHNRYNNHRDDGGGGGPNHRRDDGSLYSDIQYILSCLQRLLRRTSLSSPINITFAILWLWALSSWYNRFKYGNAYSAVRGSTGVIAYSLYGSTFGGGGDYGGGGGGGGDNFGWWDDHVGGGGEYGGSGGAPTSSRYYDGAVANAMLLPKVFPGWTMRIYHDDSVPSDLLETLRAKPGVELVDVQKRSIGSGGGGASSSIASSITNKMMWRFAVASDPSIERYCIRDVDSRLSERDHAAVQEWIASGRKFHIIRDHPSHSQHVMNGGLWCGTADAVPDMVRRIDRFQKADYNTWDASAYLKDMDFLREEVWPIVKRSVLQHDAFTCDNYPRADARGFPTLRRRGEHIGSVFVDGKIRQEDVDILMDAVRSGRQPKQCRDRNELDVEGSVSDAYGMSWSEQSSASSSIGEGNFGGDAGGGGWGGRSSSPNNLDYTLDEGYIQLRRDFDNLEDKNPWQQQATATMQQDMNKPIVNVGGRTCFKYSKGPKPERQGQITSETTFGAALRDIARRPDVRRIMETGAWYGGGSTHEFAEGIRDKANCATNSTHHCCEAFVVSFELFEPALEHARLYHQDNPVWIVKGSTVGADQMAKESEIPEDERNGEHYQLYYERDRELMMQATPKLEKFCNFIRPDVVLIDGNEYTGWAEFKLSMNTCRPRYIALHDTGTFKTKKVEKFIRNKKPELFDVVASGQDAVSWSIYRFKQPDTIGEHGFRIIVLTQKRHWSLDRLLRSIDATDYGNAKIELEIRIDYDESDDYAKTVTVAENFRFNHGTMHVHKYTRKEGLQLAWLNAWKPSSDDERAVIIEDDLELSPLWFTWLRRAWNEYGGRSDLGGISLCRQRMRASDGQHIMVERDEPFLYRLPGSFGFSPNARFWREFMNWVRTTDVQLAKLDVPGTVTSDWYRNSPDFWEQAWIWWCWTNGRSLYTLYVHSRNGALVGHWAEPGVHADENSSERNDDLLMAKEPLLESFPPDLTKFGWNFEAEAGGWQEDHSAFSAYDSIATDDIGSDMMLDDFVGGVTDTDVSSRHIVWTNDFHIATIANVKTLLEPKGVKFIDKSLSGACHETNTCATNLKVLTPENGMSPEPYTREAFFEAYKNDQQMAKVDIVMCFHPSAMCELFMPLKKRLFVIASTRYELGRESASEWEEWNKNLLAIAADSRNLVAANNMYDAKYIEYFTGLKPVLLPSWIKMDEGDMYTGISDDILVAPMHTSSAEKIAKKLKAISPRFKDITNKYGRYTFSQLAENTAIIHIPYQVSVMSLFEQYTMGIPILAPTPGFLWDLHQQLDIMSERTWQRIRTGVRPSKSPIPGIKEGHDPNNDIDRKAFMHWIKYADYYQWPHIVHFNSWKDLGRKLEETDWEVVSDEMLGFVKRAIDKTSAEWEKILEQRGNYAATAQDEDTPPSDLATYLSEFMKSVHIW